MKSESIAHNLPIESSWEDQFLDWYGQQNHPMFEKRLKLGHLDYYHFASRFPVADERHGLSFGSGLDRRSAALKCAGEAVERQVMFRYFSKNRTRFPKAFRNSNGWAVHRSRELAKQSAINEAIERHLLLLSFCQFGWTGFREVHALEAGEITVKFFESRCRSNGKASGLVAAQTRGQDGISFGYCLLDLNQQQAGDPWQSAMFEAVDKILLFDPSWKPDEPVSWMTKENLRLLEAEFDLSQIGATEDFVSCEVETGDFSVELVDVANEQGLKFPLFAAFAHGPDLIPLFWKSELDVASERILSKTLLRHGVGSIPEWHPVL
jgi:hypothetical protein